MIRGAGMEGLAAHVNVCLHTASGIKSLSQELEQAFVDLGNNTQ